jgi:hypothetical protein
MKFWRCWKTHGQNATDSNGHDVRNRAPKNTQCGFKALRDYAAERIFSVGVIEGLGFDIEMLALARVLQYKVGIVPANWINKPGSHVGFSLM